MPFFLPSFRDIVGKKVVRALRRKDDGISHACVDFLCALMQPMHDNFNLRQEQLNKTSLLSSRQFLELLLEPFKTHVVRERQGNEGESVIHVTRNTHVQWASCQVYAHLTWLDQLCTHMSINDIPDCVHTYICTS